MEVRRHARGRSQDGRCIERLCRSALRRQPGVGRHSMRLGGMPHHRVPDVAVDSWRRWTGIVRSKRSARGVTTLATSRALAEKPRVMREVIADEGRDEVVAVVVAGVATQRQRLTGLQAGALAAPRCAAARSRNLSARPWSTRQSGMRAPCGDQLGCIVFAPQRAVVSEVARKGLDAPRVLASAPRSARRRRRCDSGPDAARRASVHRGRPSSDRTRRADRFAPGNAPRRRRDSSSAT